MCKGSGAFRYRSNQILGKRKGSHPIHTDPRGVAAHFMKHKALPLISRRRYPHPLTNTVRSERWNF